MVLAKLINIRALTCGAIFAAMSLPHAVSAQEDVVSAQEHLVSAHEAKGNDFVSGSASVSYNSHFISYGLDVWGGGTDFFGSQSTMFLTTDITFDLSPFALNFGVWGDINNNAESGIGGNIQEIDVWAGVSVDIDRFTLGVTFQQWYYASDTEGILDLTVAFDDSGLLPVSLSPSLTWHFRVQSNGAQEKGSVIVLAVAPSFTLIESDMYPVTLSVPAGVAFFLNRDYQGGDKSGVGYFYLGASFSVPIGFISNAYGDWSLNFDVTYYNTSPRAIPTNPKDDFVTGSIGLSVGF